MGYKAGDVYENIVVVEWYFKCDYEGNVDGFNGVTMQGMMYAMGNQPIFPKGYNYRSIGE